MSNEELEALEHEEISKEITALAITRLLYRPHYSISYSTVHRTTGSLEVVHDISRCTSTSGSRRWLVAAQLSS